MPESKDDIGALLAEVNELANEAVADIVADDESANTAPQSSPPTASPAPRYADPIPTLSPFEKPTAQASSTRGGINTARILQIEVPVIVRLAEQTMPMAEIVALSTGAIIEFEKPADSELDLMINNKCIGQGHAVKVGENFGLRVKAIGSLRDRIQALGGN